MDGGPGYASTAAPFARSLVAALAPLLRRRDLVLFDARGSGRSDVVDCPALQNGLTQEAIAVGECANRLGRRYAGYTTAETAPRWTSCRATTSPPSAAASTCFPRPRT
jgi:pimeloyl-ACP methyl ester carboxylesterase